MEDKVLLAATDACLLKTQVAWKFLSDIVVRSLLKQRTGVSICEDMIAVYAQNRIYLTVDSVILTYVAQQQRKKHFYQVERITINIFYS